ncbi:MAG: maleylpyruvate isomerase family mycothiol-dependent enzyme [Chloroflexi bacterium]|nr:MAG: maleylpyruvate isomerase family mycothiol-dependent enzyme [Chloroflexota bacterium]
MNRSVENLAELWASLDVLLSSLDEGEWKTPTGCPGWTVQDCVSHLVDYESRVLGNPAPEHAPPELPHVRNELGRANEIGVDFRRTRSGPEVLEEFHVVIPRRLEQLRAFTDADLASAVTTPAGPGTLADMLTLRVMDTWSHEQDIRRAVGRPGHVEGAPVDEAIGYFCGLLPYVVGKRAAAPEGSTSVFRIGDRPAVVVEVSDRRGRMADRVPTDPTVELVMPAATFCALVCGRSDAPRNHRIEGDNELGQRIVDNLGVMP